MSALPDTFGVKTFPAPPADFDPHLAGDDELVGRGFPRRSDPEIEPQLRMKADRAASITT